MQSDKFCYLTLVMKGDSYIAGALVMAYVFKIILKTKHDLCVMVTPDVSPQGIADLKTLFDYIIPINYIYVPELSPYINKFTKRKWGEYMKNYTYWLRICLTKFNLFNQTQYDKICFIDADIFALHNPDIIFTYDTPTGTTKREIKGDDNSILDPQLIRKSLSQYGIRGGLILLEPKEGRLEKFIQFCQKESTLKYLDKYFNKINAGPDETLITLFYRKKWHKLNYKFMNTGHTMNHNNYFQHNFVEKPWLIKKDYPEFQLFYQHMHTLIDLYPKFSKYYIKVL